MAWRGMHSRRGIPAHISNMHMCISRCGKKADPDGLAGLCLEAVEAGQSVLVFCSSKVDVCTPEHIYTLYMYVYLYIYISLCICMYWKPWRQASRCSSSARPRYVYVHLFICIHIFMCIHITIYPRPRRRAARASSPSFCPPMLLHWAAAAGGHAYYVRCMASQPNRAGRNTHHHCPPAPILVCACQLRVGRCHSMSLITRAHMHHSRTPSVLLSRTPSVE